MPTVGMRLRRLHDPRGDSVMPCGDCRLHPCACGYIRSLAKGGRNEWLAPFAAAMAREPHPHRVGESSCPCPPCYSRRLASQANNGVRKSDDG